MERQMLASCQETEIRHARHVQGALSGHDRRRLLVRSDPVHPCYGGAVFIIGAQSQPFDTMIKSGLIGRENVRFCHDLTDALKKAASDASAPKQSAKGELMDLELQRYKAEFFKALAHPVRIRIVELLSEGGLQRQ